MMMLDFRSGMMALLPFDVWRNLEIVLCCFVAAGCIWQLVYDGKFAVVGTWGNRASRLGLIVQTTFAVAGVGDSLHCTEPHVLFIGYVSGTALIQGSLLWRWVRVGRPATLE